MPGAPGAAGAGAGAPAGLSLIVPCHNEQDNVRPFYERACAALSGAGVAGEVVFVDDGSADATWARIRELAGGCGRAGAAGGLAVQAVRFSRNFGKESAMYAGMRCARYDTLCLIDADLQQDPAMALKMYCHLVSHPGCDVVAAYQEHRRENRVLAWLKGTFYRVFNATSDGIELPADMSDFRVFTRQVADSLLSLPESFRFSKGLFAWVGFSTYEMPYTPDERNAGESSWSVRSLFRYAFTGITSFSTWPLKIAKYVGFATSLASLLYLLYVLVVDYAIFGIDIPGYATLACLILIFGGLQLFAIGLMGDYLARMYIEGKHRPLYIVKERLASEGSDETAEGRTP